MQSAEARVGPRRPDACHGVGGGQGVTTKPRPWLRGAFATALLLLAGCGPGRTGEANRARETGGAAPGRTSRLEALVRAYPEALGGFDGTDLVWRDGTRMPVGEAHPDKATGDVSGSPSILDQLAARYPAGAPLEPPVDDPGRLRNQAFFDKMYGDCRAGEVAPRLVRVAWLPRTLGRSVLITSANGVDRRLAEVSQELDELPAEFRRFLYPLGGTYNCRNVAGSDQTSMHSWGAAIDLNTAYSDYWRWTRPAGDPPAYRNRIPPEIVAIFERHGFIWGGRWAHFDTMHFEYRPELLGYHPSVGE